MRTKTHTTADLAVLYDRSLSSVHAAMVGLEPVGKRGNSYLWSEEQRRQFERAVGAPG